MMLRTIGKYLILISLLTSAGFQLFVEVHQVEADRGRQKSFSQHDLDGNGSPDQVVINTQFATDHDQIIIYAKNNDMIWGDNVQDILRFVEEIWIFDVGQDGTAQLIIDFHREGSNLYASVFDDSNGDGLVSYRIDGQKVIIDENNHPRVQVVADSSWTLLDGSVNPNLHFYVDGPILRYLEWGEAQPALDYALTNVTTDGEVDWEVEIVDLDTNGIPDYQVQRLLTDFPQFAAVFRATLYANPTQRKAEAYEGELFWPLLTSKHGYESYNYFDRPPVVAIDWKEARVDRLGIIGYPIEQGYHINSRAGWQKGVITNYADFENPMAYYDLAGDQDGRPELFVRFEVFDKNDPLVLYRFGGQLAPVPLTHVEYTWDSNNDGRWNYELGLGARFPITTVVQYADFGVRSVPYEQIPSWVNGQQWDMAVFIAAENGGYWNSEGMGEWSINRGYLDGEMVEPSNLRDLYLTGLTDDAPLEYYNEVPTGFRGEIAAHYFSEPYLYISPIDGRLHLYKATHGVWNIDEQHQIFTRDTNGDGYLDQWLLTKNDAELHHLMTTRHHLIYSTDNIVELKQIDELATPFLVQPPNDYGTWNHLRTLLEDNSAIDGERGLSSLIEQFDGATTVIKGSNVRDFRFTSKGFRFTLELLPAAEVVRNELEINFPALQPGNYLVSYEDNHFSLVPTTPPQLSATILPSRTRSRANEWQRLEIQLFNSGLSDAVDVSLCGILVAPSGQTQVLTGTIALVPGGGRETVAWSWLPETNGRWRATVAMNCETEHVNFIGRNHLLLTETIDVEPSPGPSANWLFGLGGRVSPVLGVLFVSMVLTGAVLTIVWTREAQTNINSSNSANE